MAGQRKGGAVLDAPEETKAVAVITKTTEALAVADGYGDKDDVRGKEGIEAGDITLPFLAIAQKTSPQLEPDHGKYIEGLKFTDLFNSLTGEIYGQPVTFIPISLRKHAIEYNDFKSGGGIKDRNVPWDDDRCNFNGDEKPTATRYYDWVVLLVPSMELIVLSMKSTNIAVARQFQQVIQMRQGPAFAGKYLLKVVSAKNQYGSFGKLVIVPAGKPTTEEADFAKTIYEGVKGANIVVDHEGNQDGTEAGDEGAAAPGAPEPRKDDKIPF